MTDTQAASNQRVWFSPSCVWTLAGATVTQLMRMKILGFLALFCVFIVVLGFGGKVLNPDQQLKTLKDAAFAALQVFSIVIAIVATALLLPRDLEDRTLYTILSKPVPRYEYLLGKLLGVLMLIGGGLILMDLAFSVVLWLRQNMLVAETIGSLRAEKMDSTENIAQVTAIAAKQGLTWNVHLGVLAIFLKASVITALSLMISCFASSTLFTVVMAMCVTIIGHGHELMREYFFDALSPVLKKILTALLAIVTPDLGVFDVADNVMNGEIITYAAMNVMVGTAAMYLVGYAVVSHLLFVEKEL